MPSGRLRKPLSVKKAEGTINVTRDRGKVDLPVEIPDRPHWLDDDLVASSLFDEITQYMLTMQVTSRVDGMGLSLLADQFSTYLRLRKMVLDEGDLVEVVGPKGDITKKAHPAFSSLDKTFNHLTKLLREYGLTPASRAHLESKRGSDEPINSFEDFLNE